MGQLRSLLQGSVLAVLSGGSPSSLVSAFSESLAFNRRSRRVRGGFIATSMQATSVACTEASTLEAEALSKFFPEDVLAGFAMECPADGGVSNRMTFITVPQKGRYLLRIYNNGGNSNVVKFEHEIMSQLAKKELSFQTPVALPSLDDPELTHVKLSSGDDACVFEVIPGTLPKLDAVEAIGRASGELHTVMGTLDVKTKCEQPPYYKLFEVHHAISRDKFYATILSETFDAARKDVDRLVDHVRDLEQRLDLFHAKELPQQLIHGDLHYDNVLYDKATGQVTGLLDFEYCGYDWRAMELSVCLSKYSGEPDPIPYFEKFVKGYCQTAVLTEDEVDSIPDLMVLRIISNVVYFVGRVLSGEDVPDQLMKRAGMYNARIEWLLSNRTLLANMISKEMAKKGN